MIFSPKNFAKFYVMITLFEAFSKGKFAKFNIHGQWFSKTYRFSYRYSYCYKGGRGYR